MVLFWPKGPMRHGTRQLSGKRARHGAGHRRVAGFYSAAWPDIAPPLTRDINARVNLDKSVVSRAASRLEQAGLLRKSSDDSDQRLVALDLTDQGRALMERLGRIAETFQADLMRELGEDGPQLSRTLERLMNRA